MLTAINEISIPIPYTKKKASIELFGKNLIITGGNGSGKTSFIKSIYDFLKDGIDNPRNNNTQLLLNDMANYKNQISIGGRDQNHYNYYVDELAKTEARIKLLEEFKIITEIIENGATRSLLRFHKAQREAMINPPLSVPRLANLIQDNAHFANDKDGDGFFENYLVSLKTAQSYSISFDNDIIKSEKIQAWFDKIESDLQELFEDKELKFIFDSNEGRFFLKQPGKDRFTFQTLSSGYSSILRIYADLIMRVTMWELTPESINGIIFIDEIDAHLHVSLQKQILRFFTSAFPNVQFIVTTHSPFVVTSVSDVIIYDLSTNEQVSDVSSYSNNVILEQLFGVNPVSKVLNDKLQNIEVLLDNLNEESANEIKNLIESLAPLEQVMDIETNNFIEHATLELFKYRKKSKERE